MTDFSFERDAYKLLPFFVRREDSEKGNNLLRRYFDGVNSLWDQIAARIEEIRGLPDPFNVPDEALKHVLPLLGFGGDLSFVWAALSPTDLRRLIFAAVPLWRVSSTEAAIKVSARFLTGKQFLIRNVHRFLPVMDDLTFGVSYDNAAFWLVGSSPSPHNMDSIDLHIVDEGNLNRTLLQDLLGVTRAVGEKIVVIYDKFLDKFTDTELTQWAAFVGTATVVDGTLVMGPGGTQIYATDTASFPLADLMVTTSFVVTTPDTDDDSSVQVLARVNDAGTDMYAATFQVASGVGVTREWSLLRVVGGVPTTVASGTYPFAPGVKYHVAFHCFEVGGGTLLRLSIDGAMVHQSIDATGGRPSTGKVALVNNGEDTQSVAWDVIEVIPQPAELGLVAEKVQILPTRYTLAQTETLTLTGRGGGGRFDFDFDTNNSGGTVVPLSDTEAQYTAGSAGGGSTVVDLVSCEDSFGNRAVAEITVTP